MQRPKFHSSAISTRQTQTTMKAILQILCALTALMPLTAAAQYSEDNNPGAPEKKNLFRSMDEHGVFNKIQIAANVGTTGLGLEVATPMTKWAKLRVGFDAMPNFRVPMKFGVNSYLDGRINNKFGKIQELMQQMTGMDIDETVEMDSRPTMTTFKMLVDVYPFRNRHWHFTAGFYYGGKSVGKSINTMGEMPSLVCLNMYNRLYNYVMADDFIEKILDEPIYGDFYLDYDAACELQKQMGEYGELGVHIGDYKDRWIDVPVVDEKTGEPVIDETTGEPMTKKVNEPYMMHPDKDGTVSARAFVNRFRPYVGFGYEGGLSKDGRWKIGVEAGVQFWGGVPKVTTHEGVVLNDLVNLRAKVKRYMDLMKCAPVFPSISCRLSYTF